MPPSAQPEDSAAQRLIYQAKRQWEMTVDAILDPLILIDEGYEIVRANRAVAALAQADVRAIPGQRCHETLFGRAAPCDGCPVAGALASSEARAAEVTAPNDRVYNVNAFPMPEDVGDGPGSAGPPSHRVVCTYRDVTEQRQLARRLTQAEKMAAVGQLAGGVAHEINNPLGGILAFTQLLKRDWGRSDDPRAPYLDEIEQSALRCKRIVDSLLNFSRQPRDNERRPIDVNRPVRDAIFLLHYRLRHEPVDVDEQLGEALPRVVGNQNQLQQVFVNLLTNALDAIVATGNRGRVTVRTEADARGRVVVTIADDGCGIPEHNLSRILEPFFTTKEEGKGTGLGLAICYRILEDHEATIDLKSKVGVGTTFTLAFPAAAAHDAALHATI